MTTDRFQYEVRKIFDLTALNEDDVEPEAVKLLIARELTGIAGMFTELMADGKIAESSQSFFEMLITAARIFAEVLPDDPHREMDFEDGPKPAYVAASELCFEVIDILKETELLPEWRAAFDEQCKRLQFFTLVLREDPDMPVRSV